MQQDCAFRGSFRFALAGTLLLATAAPALAGPYAAAVMADSPYAYWRFNETSGTVAADSSGNGIAGTYVTPPPWVRPARWPIPATRRCASPAAAANT